MTWPGSDFTDRTKRILSNCTFTEDPELLSQVAAPTFVGTHALLAARHMQILPITFGMSSCNSQITCGVENAVLSTRRNVCNELFR
jgi:hypothetical protein